MVVPTIGTVVLVPFPFSDLSQTKLRPAVVVADAGRGDWILCQITSNPYSDVRAVALAADDFTTGGLRTVSYARPGKLFTANRDPLLQDLGKLKDESLNHISDRSFYRKRLAIRPANHYEIKISFCSRG